MNLEHCRKDAKRLLRAVIARDPGALARASRVLGDRLRWRFGLSDAHHVVASERGYRSWTQLVHAEADPVPDALEPDRVESVVETGLEYRPGDPVRVWVLRRERRVSVSDHGAALQLAGAASGWRRACHRVHAELEVNISRSGVVWLPVVAVGPSEREVTHRIGRASLVFFQELLELEAA